MKIRRADQSDYFACVKLIPKEWGGGSGAREARLGMQLYKEYVFVAVNDQKEILGYLACDADFFDEDGFYLRTIIVNEKERRKGIGEALVRHAMDWAFTRGARRIFADVLNEQFGKLLVTKGGFEKSGEIKHMHAEGVTFSIYSKKYEPKK